jgi:hypothetical protein
MPIAVCDHCRRLYAIDYEHSRNWHCPECNQALQSLPRAEGLSRFRQLQRRSELQVSERTVTSGRHLAIGVRYGALPPKRPAA